MKRSTRRREIENEFFWVADLKKNTFTARSYKTFYFSKYYINFVDIFAFLASFF